MTLLRCEYLIPSRHLVCNEYVYHIGSFHYNWHKEIELLLILRGCVDVSSSGYLYTLEEDDMLLINSLAGHATLARDSDSTALLLHINPEFFTQYGAELQNLVFSLCTDRTCRNKKIFQVIRKTLAEMLLHQYKKTDMPSLFFEGNFFYLVLLLVRHFITSHSKEKVSAPSQNMTRLHQFTEYLNVHYRENISLESAARIWGYNPSYVSQLFKKTIGLNFYDYLRRKRLREATREIDRTDKKIMEIAYDNGFQNLKSFNNYFREIFGRSPSDYRRFLQHVTFRDAENYQKKYGEDTDLRIMEKLRSYIDNPRTNYF